MHPVFNPVVWGAVGPSCALLVSCIIPVGSLTLPCPFRYVFGLLCPFCGHLAFPSQITVLGTSRAFICICHGKWALALKHNPASLCVFVWFVWTAVSCWASIAWHGFYYSVWPQAPFLLQAAWIIVSAPIFSYLWYSRILKHAFGLTVKYSREGLMKAS